MYRKQFIADLFYPAFNVSNIFKFEHRNVKSNIRKINSRCTGDNIFHLQIGTPFPPSPPSLKRIAERKLFLIKTIALPYSQSKKLDRIFFFTHQHQHPPFSPFKLSDPVISEFVSISLFGVSFLDPL